MTFPFINALGGNTEAWRVAFAVYGGFTAAGLFAGFAMTREYVRPAEVLAKEGDKKYGFVDNIKDFCKKNILFFH